MSEMTALPQKDRAELQVERTRGGVHFVPRVEIIENDQELLLIADLPGVRPEDVDLHYERGELTLHGRVAPRQHEEPFLLQEYEVGDWYRSFTISESIDAVRIEAACKNGILTVRLPKVEEARPRQIRVKGN